MKLNGPNDLVFDKHGGFYFTDLGKGYGRLHDRGAVYYATPDGKTIKELVFPIDMPNGCGLSPDEKTLYVAQTMVGRLMKFDITAPGELAPPTGPLHGDLRVRVAGVAAVRFAGGRSERARVRGDDRRFRPAASPRSRPTAATSRRRSPIRW